MNTDARELTDEEINERESLAEDYDARWGMKIVQTDNGTFNGLKNAVFTAFVLGMGCVVWMQQQTNASFEREIAVLKLECRNIAQARQP